MESIFSFLGNYIGEAIALFLGLLIKWIFDKNKEKVDLTSKEIENGADVVKMYKDALVDIPEQTNKRLKQINEYWTEKVIFLEERLKNIESLSKEKERITKDEITFIKRERDLWKRRYTELNKEYNQYKKEHP